MVFQYVVALVRPKVCASYQSAIEATFVDAVSTLDVFVTFITEAEVNAAKSVPSA